MLDILNKFPVTDNGDGTYTVKGLPVGEYCYMVEKEGYFASNPATVSIINQDVSIEVILQKYPNIPFYNLTFSVKDSNDNTISLSDASITTTNDYDMATLPQYDQFYYFDLTGLNAENNPKFVYYPLSDTNLADAELGVDYSFTIYTSEGVFTDSGNTVDNNSSMTFENMDDATDGKFGMIFNYEDSDNGVPPIQIGIGVEDWMIRAVGIVNTNEFPADLELEGLEMKFKVHA